MAKFIWFHIPEYIFGEPLYDQGECIAYIVNQLETNGFFINYMHPNTLYVSWENWVPSYVRSEIKKKRGIVVDEKGNIVKQDNDEDMDDNMNSKFINEKNSESSKKDNKQYTPIQTYKPTGIYRKEIFEKLEKRL